MNSPTSGQIVSYSRWFGKASFDDLEHIAISHFHTDHFIKKPGWELAYAADNLGIEDNETSELVIFPNPTSGITVIRYRIPSTNQVTGHRSQVTNIDLFSMDGRKVMVVEKGIQLPGEYEFQFDFSDLPDGVYFVRLTADKETAVRKVIVSK